MASSSSCPDDWTGCWFRSPLLLAEAKGVAGLGKAGGDGQGGSDKAGQQVPPEVYMALTYAGSLFLFTLSVPLILYGLNKLLNKIEDCFGCGASRRKAKTEQQPKKGPNSSSSSSTVPINSQPKQQLQNNLVNSISAAIGDHHGLPPPLHPDSTTNRQLHLNQRLDQFQPFQQQQLPKYKQFISASPDYNSNNNNNNNISPDNSVSLDKLINQPLVDVGRQPSTRKQATTATTTTATTTTQHNQQRQLPFANQEVVSLSPSAAA